MASDDDPRIEALESKVTFQEDTIQKLNDVVTEQDVRIHELENSLRLLIESIRQQSTAIEAEPENDPPPHY